MLRLSDIQILKLGKTLHQINSSNFFYAQRFPSGRITSYEELTSLPFMSMHLLAQGYPFAYSCADTGTLTLGHLHSAEKEPVMNLYTDQDTAHLAEMTARAFSIAGIDREDTLLMISDSSDCPQYLSAAEKLKHFLIPAGELNHRKLHQLILDTDATCLLGDSDSLIKFVENCRKSSIDLTGAGLKSAVLFGKPLTDGTRKHAEKETGMNIFHTFGSDGFLTGMGADCKEHSGFHVWDDHYIAEIIDPETEKPVTDGEEGELAVTTLSLNALPLIRFKTGKISKIVSREKCPCGLDTPVISYPR